uniref:Cell wall-associated hydrolase n=1 Tax=uncultured bacterium 5G4 TaxID=1701326 RepID=A0A166H323_9BACT|nr:cell wall-associated hydrolase [uncultured bacterium 5G4]
MTLLLSDGRSNLEMGFALRCFQRLSRPDLATRQCPWQNNRYTSGPSIPVLSY